MPDKRNATAGNGGAPKVFDGTTANYTGDPYTYSDAHSAWLSGYDQGVMHANRVAAEAIAAELLHARSLEALGMARRSAEEKGPAWTALVMDVAEQDWQGWDQ